MKEKTAIPYSTKCPKCCGTGLYKESTDADGGTCLACKGTGEYVFKNSRDALLAALFFTNSGRLRTEDGCPEKSESIKPPGEEAE